MKSSHLLLSLWPQCGPGYTLFWIDAKTKWRRLYLCNNEESTLFSLESVTCLQTQGICEKLGLERIKTSVSLLSVSIPLLAYARDFQCRANEQVYYIGGIIRTKITLVGVCGGRLGDWDKGQLLDTAGTAVINVKQRVQMNLVPLGARQGQPDEVRGGAETPTLLKSSWIKDNLGENIWMWWQTV